MFLTASGKKIHYQTVGNGPPVLLIHGWGGSTLSLLPLAHLLSQHHTVIVIDLPGFGKSDPPDPEWGIREYAQAIKETIAALHIPCVVYFGHSFGGSLGIYLTAHHQDIIKKLILCGSSFKRTPQKTTFFSFLKKLPCQKHIITPLRRLFYTLFYPSSDAMKFPRLEPVFRNIIGEDLTPLLNKIRVSTLILWGDKDTETPPHLAHILNTGIVNSKLVMFKDLKHGFPLTHPRVIYKEIQKWI